MNKIALRKMNPSDIRFFYKWWRNKELIRLTSGDFNLLDDWEVEKHFLDKLNDSKNLDYMITLDGRAIGNVSLVKRKNNWYETQIVIGERKDRGKGYGGKAIKMILQRAQRRKIFKIYLEVRTSNEHAIKTYLAARFAPARIIKYPKNKNLPQVLRMELGKAK